MSASSRVELFTLGVPVASAIDRLAGEAEAEGWDGMLITDSQNLSNDTYICLALAAKATSTLKLGTGVTNPVTRHAAVTASAIATVQQLSGGRAILGIGRGDSALFTIGLEPSPLKALRSYVSRVQGYLSGDDVDLDGTTTFLRWVRAAGLPKVPVDVAGTGPKVIAIGATLAERVTFAVGANTERLTETVTWARNAANDRPVSLGAYVHVSTHPDLDVACNLIRTSVGTFAHFSGMPGGPREGRATEDQVVFDDLDATYDRAGHGTASAGHGQRLPADFIERFAVVGDPDRCVDRLRSILGTGLDRLVVIPPSPRVDPDAAALARRLLTEEVIPHVRVR